MKFIDYESSHITPQMTLLKKFNEVLKYLRGKEDIIYRHKISIDANSKLYLYSFDDTPLVFTYESGVYKINGKDAKIYIQNHFPQLEKTSALGYILSISGGGGTNLVLIATSFMQNSLGEYIPHIFTVSCSYTNYPNITDEVSKVED